MQNPNVLYDKIVLDQKQLDNFWGYIPKDFLSAITHIKSHNELKPENQQTVQLQKILTKYHKKLGIYTPKVASNIEKISKGSILMGQQPTILGGPGFIGNKFGCLVFLNELAQKNDLDLAPIFFLGDYDGLQKELTRLYYPNPISQSAIIIDSEQYLPEDSDIAAHAAILPPIEWLDENIAKLEENLIVFRKRIKGDKKRIYFERWSHIKSIIKVSFTNSVTLSEWAARIWGYIVNIVEDLGIVFLPTSHPEIRKLVGPEFHRFLINADDYTQTFNKAMKELEDLGYGPTLPHRHKDYSPFTIECPDDNYRITTTIRDDGNDKWAEGKCACCDNILSYKVTSIEDINQISETIGPRVDSSQAIFQDILNIKIRISGPGETAYYAQTVPALKKIGFEVPLFIKYKRAYYNTPWNEELGKLLISRNQSAIQSKELFEMMRERYDGIKNQSTETIHELEKKIHDNILNGYEKLISTKPSGDILKYLGWQFGKYDQFKFGQEVSWPWIDMALQTGVGDYISTYKRMYHEHSILGHSNFINTNL